MSTQLDAYLAARFGDGLSTEDAAFDSGIGLAEARLTDAAVARGEITAPQRRKEETVAKKAKPNDAGSGQVSNLTDTKNTIRDAVAQILKFKSERKEINAAIGEQRARVKNCGVPPAALDLAIRMKEADQEDRQAHDEGYAIARDALGMGIQPSLFETLGTSDDMPPPPPTNGSGAVGAAPDAVH